MKPEAQVLRMCLPGLRYPTRQQLKVKTSVPLSLTEFRLDLQLLDYTPALILTEKSGIKYVFDPIRKKNIILQPEEMVRQLMIQWLIENSTFSRNAIQVEKLVTVNKIRKRFDILLYNSNIQPYILIECKSPAVTINQSVFDQISVYNLAMKAPYLIVTNGHSSWMVQQNMEEKKYQFFSELPSWLTKP